MSANPETGPEAGDPAALAERHAALFFQMVTGHTQMVLTFLGRLPNPHTGEPGEINLEAAELFIDQLEMLQGKTLGNLSGDESKLLAEALSVTQTAFVEVVEGQPEEAAESECDAGSIPPEEDGAASSGQPGPR